MKNLRLLLLATTALTALQFASVSSHAQSAPLVVAQAAPKEELGPDGKPKQPPKGAPPKGAPPKPAPPPPPPPRPAPPAAAPPPPPRPAPPPAAPPRPEAPQPRAEPPHRPEPPPPGAAPQPPHPVPPRPPTPPAPPNAAPVPQPGAPAAVPPPVLDRRPPPQQVPGGAPPPGRVGPPPAGPNAAPAGAGGQTALPPGGTPLARRAPPPTVTAPIPTLPPRAQALTPIAPGAVVQGPQRMEDFRGQRQESDQGGRKVFTEPGRIIVVDPSGQSFIRHDEDDRFRYGARDIRVERVGSDTRTIVIRPDGTEIINITGPDGLLLRRIRRDREGRELIIIDNSYRDPGAIGGFFIDLPPPVLRIPYDRYIVEADVAPPELIYETIEAPPVERIERRYSLDEIRYSPSVRALMPSIDLNTINFETGSWEIPPDQAARLQAIADGLNRAIARNPREVFLIEGHTDAVGNDVDNLSLSDRRAESAAELLTQQFGVPAENLTSQGYGSQYLKEQTSGPSRINRRVTVRRITPLLNGGTASLPPPPPGIAPPR